MTNPQLTGIERQLAEATARVRRFQSVAERRFVSPPRPQAWSAAECVRHLSLTTSAYLTLIDSALTSGDATPVDAAHRYRPDLIGRFLAWMIEPPFRTKTKTIAPFQPIAVSTQAAVIAEFEQLQQALTTRVQRCEGRRLERIRIVSPFNARAKYNLYSALIILTAHQRRHLWQADRALEATP